MSQIDEIVALTMDLIRIPSMHTKPKEITRCAKFILEWCAQHGIQAEMVEHNGIPSVFVLPEPGKANYVLMTHIDVVIAPDDMFEPRVEGDILHGRGAIDDKYAAAISLVVFKDRLKALREQGLDQKDMAFGLLITGDEEAGGYNGAAKALADLETDYVIALDAGGPGKLTVRHKGILDVKLTAQGKAGHAAYPWLSVNAAEILADDIVAMRVLFSETNEEHWHRTANLSILEAGESIGKVPGTAEARYNIRYTDKDDPEKLVKDIQAVVKSEVEVLRQVSVFDSTPSVYRDMLLEISGAEPTSSHGACDTRFLKLHGLNGAAWGAEGWGLHALDERASISSMEKVANSLSEMAIRVEKNIHVSQ